MIDTRSAALRMQPVLAVLLGLAVAGCGPKNEYQAPPPPEVTVARPVSQVISRSLQFTGTTSPVEKVEIRARVSGYLDKVAFTDGMNVEAGELLFVIDQAPFQTALRQAEATQRLAEARVESSLAEFDKARAEAENAQAQLARGERAARGGAVTEGELDDLRTTRDAAYASAKAAQAAIASSRAEVEAAAAQVASAKLDLSYTEVRSPIKGRVGEAEVDVGNLVGASDPTLLTTVVRYNP
ncbi:MAG: biotin/lipoyl-binding protein, partial [Planctomycetota bacterium]